MGRHFPVMSKRSCRSDLLIFQQMCCTITMYASYSVHSCRMAQDSTSEASVSGRQLWTNLYSRGSEMLNRSLLAVLNCLLLQKEKEKKKKREKYISYYDTRHRNGWTVWINQSPSIFMNLLCSICVFNLIKWRLHHNNKMCHWCTISLIWIVSQRNTIWTGLWYWQLSVNNGLHYVLQ